MYQGETVALRYRSLGKTGLRVSELGFGCWGIGGNAHGYSYGPTDDATSLAALHRAYELGCTFFDTTDRYGHGHSERLLGQAIRQWERDSVIIATQGGYEFGIEGQATQHPAGHTKQNFSERYLRRALEGSLQRLGIDTIDLYQLHTPPLELIQHAQVFDMLRTLQKEGKIRFYGLSIQDPQEGVQAIQKGGVDSVQAIYNLFDTRLEKHLIPICTETNTGLVTREPLARGFLSGHLSEDRQFDASDIRASWPKPLIQKRLQAAQRFQKLLEDTDMSLAQLALSYPLTNVAVSSVIVGCKTPEQVDENFATMTLPPICSKLINRLRDVQASL